MSILLIRDVDTISMGRSILNFRGNRSTFVNYARDEFISLSFLFKQTVSADPDKELPYAAFHLGLHCFFLCLLQHLIKIPTWWLL